MQGLHFPLPRSTAALIEQYGKRPGPRDNVSLWLDKLIPRRPGSWSLTASDRSDALDLGGQRQSVAGQAGVQRLRRTVAALHPGGLHQGFVLATLGRLLVDYGRASAVETSASLQPIWGVPRIPGSALKGVTRAAAAREGFGQARLEDLFGETTQAGRLVFYDAYPVDGRFELALDVLTPHFADYYQGHEAPSETLSPIPFTFLTVVQTQFQLLLGVERRPGEGPQVLPRLEKDVREVSELLRRVLAEDGVGAKTSAGYGRFKEALGR